MSLGAAAVFGSILQGGLGLYGDMEQRRHDKFLADEQQAYNRENAAMQNIYNIGMWERQKKHNLEMWWLNNHYNSPTMQMARLKAAGLNPHLMYGKGTVGNAAGPPTQANIANAADIKGYTRQQANNLTEGLQGAIGNYFQFRALNAQADNLESQKAVNDQEAYNRSIDAAQKAINLDVSRETKDAVVKGALHNAEIAEANAAKGRIEADIAKQTKSAHVQMVKKELELLKQRIKGQKKENVLKEYQKSVMKLKAELAEEGVRDTDSIIYRILVQRGLMSELLEHLLPNFKLNQSQQ